MRRLKFRASAGAKGVVNVRAPSGQPFTQAQQRMQRSASVAASLPGTMAPVGQAAAQRPQWVQRAASACGARMAAKRSGWRRITSSVCVPIEPVEPSIAILRLTLSCGLRNLCILRRRAVLRRARVRNAAVPSVRCRSLRSCLSACRRPPCLPDSSGVRCSPR